MSQRPSSRALKRLFRRHFNEGQPPAGGWELLNRILDFCGSLDHRSAHPQRYGDLHGLLHIRDAIEILWTPQLPRDEARILQTQLRQLFTHLRRLHDRHPEWALAALPELSRNRVQYFLWKAGRGQLPAAWALLTPCLNALRRAEQEWPDHPEVERGALERLPFQLAQFIRTFPPGRLAGRRLIGSPSVADIRTAFACRRASPRGFQSLKTEDEYVTAVSRALGLSASPTLAGFTVSTAGWSALQMLRRPGLIEGEGDTHAELLGELDGTHRGMLAYPAELPTDAAHPIEDAVWICPKGSKSWTTTIPRTDQYVQIWDGTGLTPNELTRLLMDLTRPDLSKGDRRFGFLVGAIAWTGLLPKRILRAHIWPGDGEDLEAWLAAHEGAITADPTDLIIFGPRARTLWVKVPQELLPIGSLSGTTSLSMMRLPLPPPIWRLAEIGWSHVTRDRPPGPLAFQNGAGQLIDIAELGGPLQRLGRRIAPLDPDLRLSRLRHTLRPYAIGGGLSSIIPALASGSPALQERVLLHYVRYPAAAYWDRCDRAQHELVRIAHEVYPESATGWQCEPDPLPSWLPSGHYGARFGVEDAALRQAWCATRLALRSARRVARRLNLATLLTATLLIGGAGVRELELPAVRRDRVDLQAGLLRLRGKANRYFNESREVPLNGLLIAALTRYRDLLERLHLADAGEALLIVDVGGAFAPLQPGDLDRVIDREGLGWAWPFRPAWLRHWLRTKLELGGVEEAAVNEAFGHATQVMTALHPLASASIPRLQHVFRVATTAVLAGMVEEGW